MILHRFENGDLLERRGQTVLARLAGRRRCLSTSPLNGGIREDLDCAFNQDCKPLDGSPFVMAEATYEEHLRGSCAALGLSPERTTGMITTAQMDNLALAGETYGDTTVTAAATGGIDVNGGRAGDPAEWHEGRGPGAPAGGTINIMLFISADLPADTLARALVTCTEAKAAALQELLAPSLYSTGIATGSGTDSVILLCDAESPVRLTYAGKHCKLGELIGRTTLKAVKEALFRQTGLGMARQLNLFARLGRFGVSREALLAGLPAGSEKRLDALAADPQLAVFASLYAHVLDQLQWGMIPEAEARTAARRLLEDMKMPPVPFDAEISSQESLMAAFKESLLRKCST